MRILLALFLSIVLTIGAACGGNAALDKDSIRMMKTALVVASGLEIEEIKTERGGLSISYEQVAGDSQAVQLRRSLNLATVAMSFMDKPQTITVIAMEGGSPVSRVTIEAGDLAALLIGEKSLDETLSRIKIEAAR